MSGAGSFLLPWEKAAAGGGRMRENPDELRFSLISHALHASFSQGRSEARDEAKV
jgi:hypothetical protein